MSYHLAYRGTLTKLKYRHWHSVIVMLTRFQVGLIPPCLPCTSDTIVRLLIVPILYVLTNIKARKIKM